MVGAESEGQVPGSEDTTRKEHEQVAMISRKIQETDDVEIAVALLLEHRGMLAHHFSAEEAFDGLYDTVLEIAPHEEHRLSLLRAQHAVMLERIDKVVQGVETGERPDSLLKEIKDIGSLLKKHEAAEGSLLLEVFNTDLGTCD